MAVDMLLRMFPALTPDDLISAPMGMNGPDIIMSAAAKKAAPFSVECKAKASGYTAIYDALEQASRGDDLTALAYIKQDRRKPLVVMYADDFERLFKPTD